MIIHPIIKIVAPEKDCGLGIALNEGFKFCENDLVARMDTDDICVADRFEKQLKAFWENESVSVVGGYEKVKYIGYEDYDLCVRLIMAGKKIVNIEDILVNVRVGNDMYKRRGDKR